MGLSRLLISDLITREPRQGTIDRRRREVATLQAEAVSKEYCATHEILRGGITMSDLNARPQRGLKRRTKLHTVVVWEGVSR